MGRGLQRPVKRISVPADSKDERPFLETHARTGVEAHIVNIQQRLQLTIRNVHAHDPMRRTFRLAVWRMVLRSAVARRGEGSEPNSSVSRRRAEVESCRCVCRRVRRGDRDRIRGDAANGRGRSIRSLESAPPSASTKNVLVPPATERVKVWSRSPPVSRFAVGVVPDNSWTRLSPS